MCKKYSMILITMLFTQENIDYNINIWGIPAAKCNYSIVDTFFYDVPSKKIKYKAETIGLYDFFYPVKNNYTIVFNTNTYDLLYYEKNSFQPNVVNEIKTRYDNGEVSYLNGDVINYNETNIFILLYLLSKNNHNILEKFPIIDREGKSFSYNLSTENNSLYSLSLNSISNSDFSVVNDTDIFTWGLFLDNTQNFIFINNEDMLVDKCIFKKGLIKLVAKREK